MIPVATVFLREGTEVLLLRRSDEVGSYPGRWGAVSGHVADHGDPESAARAEIREETGLEDARLVRAGEPFTVEEWQVHPFLFEVAGREIQPNWETDAWAWVHPTEMLRRETVPDLWKSYERVAPTVDTVQEDTDHGSTYLSVRALECLRDRAAVAPETVPALARDLLQARPSMRVIENRVNRVMQEGGTEKAARNGIERSLAADSKAAHNAAAMLPERVLTLSRSGTVLAALRAAEPHVFVAESRPAREGVTVAEELAESMPVTLHTDAAIAHVLATEGVDAVLVGADAVLADGSVVNKTGTRGAALAATHEGIPVYVVCARDKIAADETAHLESGPDEEIHDSLDVLNPTFDVTPPEAISAVVTEDGALSETDVRAAAREHAALADWD
ncbi:NUDIX domain-containing protein [Natronomonas sp. EA1]|uniref:NUDIX domain-containing protein n=1 Tax=Natronomonas sp. EA1 TaxID=3421655 RepID=UPI003EBB7885